ncbi:MAG: hypothetical protein ACW9XA_05725 [Candidatus Nitrosopumilus sp. bin_6a]
MTISTRITPELIEYECECSDVKKFRIVFDGDSTGNYIIEYCQKCFDSDDKQFLISTEVLL